MSAEIQELWLSCNGRLFASTSVVRAQTAALYQMLVAERYPHLVELGTLYSPH